MCIIQKHCAWSHLQSGVQHESVNLSTSKNDEEESQDSQDESIVSDDEVWIYLAGVMNPALVFNGALMNLIAISVKWELEVLCACQPQKRVLWPNCIEPGLLGCYCWFESSGSNPWNKL